MAYDPQSIYNKHQSDDCDCDTGNCTCGCKTNCDNPPAGLVEVFDECSKSAGYLTPNDAEEYNNAKIVCPEGYIKLKHPVTGAHLGCVTPEDALSLTAALTV